MLIIFVLLLLAFGVTTLLYLKSSETYFKIVNLLRVGRLYEPGGFHNNEFPKTGFARVLVAK